MPVVQSIDNKDSKFCIIIGHDIEAITSSVVLASLGQQVHIYADLALLEQQLQQYSFEHHLQALWQLYTQQQQITIQALPDNADTLIQRYEKIATANSSQPIAAL